MRRVCPISSIWRYTLTLRESTSCTFTRRATQREYTPHGGLQPKKSSNPARDITSNYDQREKPSRRDSQVKEQPQPTQKSNPNTNTPEIPKHYTSNTSYL
jgi:hypothetical protein